MILLVEVVVVLWLLKSINSDIVFSMSLLTCVVFMMILQSDCIFFSCELKVKSENFLIRCCEDNCFKVWISL